ncbi:hypothetical protein BBJ28_00012030 [Nothophytophthora sp. Chile5]|nr:hypothetical protein BBJ28_00012030 [Nothophytophthora sp. Chile5]
MSSQGGKSASSRGGVSSTPCSFFAAGKCRNGASCKFFHAAREDLAVSPLPCKFFLQGTCKAGRECKFSHSQDAQAAVTRVSASTGEKTVAPGSYGVPCKFFKYGECSAGDRCPYVHQQKKQERNAGETEAPIAEKAQDDEEKAPVVAESGEEPGKDESSSDRDVTELRDFISKEEAPGEFDNQVDGGLPSPSKQSYVEVAKKNVPNTPVAFDNEAPAPPYVCRLLQKLSICVCRAWAFAVLAAKCVSLYWWVSVRSKICTFFLQGLCRYGDTCFYSHSLRERVESEDEMLAMGEEIRLSQDLECGICYDNIIAKGERFGLLSGCNHPFCLTCLRNWRGNADQPKQTVRQCPLCRVETNFIIPSSRMVTKPERKQVLIDEYRVRLALPLSLLCLPAAAASVRNRYSHRILLHEQKNLSAIPCRHFDEGKYVTCNRLRTLRLRSPRVLDARSMMANSILTCFVFVSQRIVSVWHKLLLRASLPGRHAGVA